MQVNWGRVARALFATVILTMSALAAVPASAGTAQPAPAAEVTPAGEPGPYRILNLKWTQCLDTNGTDVFLWHCSSSDRGQQWIVWNGGFTKNVAAAGMCLRGMPHHDPISYPVKLVSCDLRDRNQYWRNWQPGGWYKNLSSNACLLGWWAGNPRGVQTYTCEESADMYWDVRLWP